MLAKPDGRERALKLLEETKRRDPKLVLFPEGELNAYGDALLAAGNRKEALHNAEKALEVLGREVGPRGIPRRDQ